jgi:hypothetical protein
MPRPFGGNPSRPIQNDSLAGVRMKHTYQAIYDQQRVWATRRGIPFDQDGYTLSLDDNLFLPLSMAARSKFAAGSGDELGTAQKRGKMQALHSSSALAYNIFEYWRDRPMIPLAHACGAPHRIAALQFEQTYPTGLRGTAPHLDVTLRGIDTKPFVIEAKFTEPYQACSAVKGFQQSYFSTQPGLWVQRGLPSCEALARAIGKQQIYFSRLGAAQLLKHILGLAKAFSNNFTLLYLWYDQPSLEAQEHRTEIELFMRHMDGEIDFHIMTYNELFDRLRSSADIEDLYLSYLEERYFAIKADNISKPSTLECENS